MKSKHPYLDTLMPCLSIGLGIMIFLSVLYLMIHILFWGLLIGLGCWIVLSIKERFFTKQNIYPSAKTRKGRIFEHKR